MTFLLETLGPLGAGKTTAVRAVERAAKDHAIACAFIYEDVSTVSSLMFLFNEDAHAYSYPLQAAFYIEYARALRAKLTESPKVPIVMSDSSLWLHHYGYSALLAERGVLGGAHFRALETLYCRIVSELNIRIRYLAISATSEQIQRSLAKRSRPEDKLVDISSIEFLAKAASQVPSAATLCFSQLSDIKVIVDTVLPLLGNGPI